MKCIIYGLGSGRLRVERYLKNEHDIIGYSDTFYVKDTFNDKKFYKPSELKSVYFDYIIICVGDISARTKIKKELVNYGVKSEKVIEFYLTYRKYINLEKSIREKEGNNYESIVLGISHSLYGISKSYLKYKSLKLCAAGQDLFYNLEKLKMNLEIIKKCKCAIVDMHTYTYFNYDISLGKAALDYILENDFIDNLHNFNRNSNYNSIEEELSLLNVQAFENLFNVSNIDGLEDYIESGVYSKEYLDIYDERCLNPENLELRKLPPSNIQRKIFTNTERENIRIFEDILRTLKQNNKEIKIYLVLIPQYIETENNIKQHEENWKIRFYDVLNKLSEKYEFKILDFKECQEISGDCKYYCDNIHLNATGSIRFTQLLNSYIE